MRVKKWYFRATTLLFQGGMYTFQLFDYYACNGGCILLLCVSEVLAVGWLFGRYVVVVLVLEPSLKL